MNPAFNVPKWAIAAFVPLVAAASLLATWAVDTAAHAGEVPRNVTIGGEAIGGLGEDDLRARIQGAADRFDRAPVSVETADGYVMVSAGELGMSVDVGGTINSVRKQTAGPDVLGPITWLDSFVESRTAELVLAYDEAVATTTLSKLDLVAVEPIEPRLDGSTGELKVLDGVAGTAIDIVATARRIPNAFATAADTVAINAIWRAEPPKVTRSDIEVVLAEADVVVSSGARMRVNNFVVPLPSTVAATWFSSEVTISGSAVVVMDYDLALDDIRTMMAPGNQVGSDNGVFEVIGGEVTVSADRPNRQCCLDHAVTTLLRHIRAGRTDAVELPVDVSTPASVLEAAAALGIVEEVGTFTTKHAANQPRVTNIQLFADKVRGHVMAPGETVSFNELVGKRTRAAGFVGGGFISNGVMVSDIGGGVSQFATTMFNAAFFAGLDFPSYQAHSIYFSRYPFGREATISWPQPDLVIENTTPYGVLIWPTYTPTTITVTLYSTRFVHSDQTGQRTSWDNLCRRVSTERTRAYVDGTIEVDYFGAIYRPEGQNCDGSPSDPSLVVEDDEPEEGETSPESETAAEGQAPADE